MFLAVLFLTGTDLVSVFTNKSIKYPQRSLPDLLTSGFKTLRNGFQDDYKAVPPARQQLLKQLS